MERVLRLYLDDADVVQGELSVLFDERNIGECSRGVAALAITGMVGFTSRLVLPTGMDNTPHSVSAEPDLKGEWTVGETIGFGANSLLRLVKRTVGGEDQLFVLKEVRLRNKHGYNRSLNEIEMLYKFQSDLIPTLYDACIDTTPTPEQPCGTAYLLMDFKAGGDLANFLIKKCDDGSGPLTEAQTKAIIRPMIEALQVFHSQDCIYRDLKPENLYVDDKSNISLGDLEFVTKESDVKPGVAVGTPGFLAPEVVKQVVYTKAVDFWSVGATMYAMLTLTPPEWVNYGHPAATKTNLKMLSDPVQISAALKVLSEEGRDFLKRLLKVDVADRFGSVDEMKEHAWLSDPSKGTAVDTADIFGKIEMKFDPDNFELPYLLDESQFSKTIPTGDSVIYFSPGSDFQGAMKQDPDT